MDFFSVCVGFLAGAATGAAGTYFGNKYTDQRKEKELLKETNNFYKKIWNQHEKLLAEMREDLKNPEHKFTRDFFILSKRWCFNNQGKSLAYFYEDHEDVEQQMKIFQSYGLIRDVTEFGKDVKKYQFTEPFVERLTGK